MTPHANPRNVLLRATLVLSGMCVVASWALFSTPAPAVEPPAPDAPDVEPTPETPHTRPPRSVWGWWAPALKEQSRVLRLQRFTDHGRERTLASALGKPSAVTVVNIWATYCAPCKRELADFKRQQPGWGREVKFVPIELAAGEPAGAPDDAPQTDAALLDVVPGGTVQAILGDVLPQQIIPITLLLDCRGDLRWYHSGAIDDMGIFNIALQALRDELGTPACAEVKRPPPPVDALRPVQEPVRALKICRNEDIDYDCRINCTCAGDDRCQTGSGRCPGPTL